MDTRFDPRRMTLSPPHRKKVIYVNQFAISDMMKAVDAHADGHKRVERFWLELFEGLERVCKLQLAVCPFSPVHRDESLVSRTFEPLKRMYEQLSNGVTFHHGDQIEQKQTDAALVAWLDGRAAEHPADPERITNGSLHEWQGRFLVTVSMKYPDERVAGIRRRRSRLTASLGQWFEDCRQRIDKSFDYALAIESDGCRDGLLGAYNEWVNRQIDLAHGRKPFTPENVSPSPGAEQVSLILEVLKRRGVSQENIGRLLLEFLSSEQFRNTPVNRISTRLFASIAHAAANGQRRPPDQGMANDINVVSAYLPYCDAMLIDNRVRAMLTSLPKRHALDYPCRVFSRNNGDEFLAYLGSIEQEADPLILSLVRQVYGQDWPRPFLTMYDVERRRAKHD